MNAPGTETELEEPTVTTVARCIECSELIASDAKKCRHCGAYQRRSHRWSGPLVTILSLMVAIVSLVLGGIDDIRDLVLPQTPLFAVLEETEGREVMLVVHNESDDSIIIEDMMCFRAFSADPSDGRFMDSLWMNDESPIISPGSQSNYAIQWMASGEVSQSDNPSEEIPRASISVRRWNSSCGCDPDRDMNETIDVPVTVCRLYFRTSRNAQEIYDFRAHTLDSAMRSMIEDWPADADAQTSKTPGDPTAGE